MDNHVFNYWEFNEKVIKSLPIPMIVVDDNYKVLIINKGFKDLFSTYKKNLRRGLNLSTILINHTELYERIVDFIKLGHEKARFVYTMEDQFYLVNLHIVEHTRGSSFILTFNNVTKQEEEEEIRRKFISIVAHELRTPLAAVSSHAELIAYHENMDKEEMRETAQTIYLEAQRLSKMVTELLDISKFDEMQIKLNRVKFNIKDLIAETKQLYKAKDQRDDVEIIFNSVDLDVYADYDKIKQVLINLIENAYVHTETKVEINLVIKNKKLRMSVIDDGVGLTIDQKNKVFDRFYRTDESRNRNYGGTGLGLSIVKEIVELHNGTVFIQSELGKGSEFIVEFPIKGQ